MKDTTDSSIRLNISKWLTDGIIIAGLSAYVYVLAFFYEKGFADHFNFPRDFISINLSTLAFISLSLLLAAVLLGLISYYPGRFIIDHSENLKKNRKNRFTRAHFIIIMTCSAIPIILFAYMFGVYWQILLLTILYIFFIFNEYVFFSKLKSKAQHLNIFKWLSRICLISFFLIGGTMVAEGVGTGMAGKQEKFAVLCSSPELVVLKKYGDLLICSEFNRETGELKRDRRIVRLGEKTEIKIRLETLGPLTSCATEGNGKERTAEDESDAREE